jgi:hypothetical protein
MTTTMNLIARQTVGAGGAASVTFSNIPQTFTDLKLVTSIRGTSGSYFTQGTRLTFNSSTSGYSTVVLKNIGANSAVSGFNDYGVTSASIGVFGNNAASTANTFNNAEIYIPNYTGSNNKSFSIDTVSEHNGNGGYEIQMGIAGGLLSNTAAITSITLTPQTGEGNYAEFTELSLYGISSNTTTQATTIPYASGGDRITSDGTYWYHTFLSSGVFTPLKNLTCDYLVVAGGGGGGNHNAGGGGGGGLRSTVTATGGGGTLETPLSLLANISYAASIGAGGAGGPQAPSLNKGISGVNSTFATITSNGGAGGGTQNGANTPITGGSGGGGSGNGGSGSSGTTNQGFAGGSGVSGVNAGGGGGGAGQAGVSASGTTAGNGGNGVAVSITGSSVTYAGGGGGSSQSGTQGAAGTGGASAGQLNAAVNATANTGGGAGGRNRPDDGAGANGGSGIIVVRYAV